MTTEGSPSQERGAGSLGTVLQVVSSDAVAGTERHVVGLTRELRLLGCDARIVRRASARALAAYATGEGVPSLTFFRALLATASVVHAHDGRAAGIAPLIGERGRASLVRTQHFVRPASVNRDGPARYASMGTHRVLNRCFSAYIAVSQAASDAARERNEIGAASVAVIPPGIRLPDATTLSNARIRRRNSEHPVVASAGRLEDERRFDVLVRAMPRVLQKSPACRFVIAGSGSAEGDLRRLATQLRVDSSITWTGWLPGIGDVLSASHVYVNTWPWEGFGMATAEAMAFELPVVVTTSGASAELIDGGAAGVAVAPADPNALADAIGRLLEDPGRAAALAERAREHAERYSIVATAASTLALYNGLRADRA